MVVLLDAHTLNSDMNALRLAVHATRFAETDFELAPKHAMTPTHSLEMDAVKCVKLNLHGLANFAWNFSEMCAIFVEMEY